MKLSKQAEDFVKYLKDFNRDDFEKWWNELPTVTSVGTNYIFQYFDMK